MYERSCYQQAHFLIFAGWAYISSSGKLNFQFLVNGLSFLAIM